MKILSKNSEVERLFIREVEGKKNFGDVSVKPMIAGDEMTMLEIHYPPQGGAPPHIHKHETLCYVVRGKVKVTVADEEFEMGEGDACLHPQGVPHGIIGIDDSLVLEIKSPAQPLSKFLRMTDK